MNAKRKGTRSEHKTMRYLERAGYHCIRSAASLSPWDIVGVGTHDVVLVQVKTNRRPGRQERAVLTSFPCPPNCRKLVYVWYQYQREPEVITILSFNSTQEDICE